MINLLVVTSDIPLGEQLRQNLEEMGRFRVHVAEDKGAAVSHVIEDDCPLAFLDACLGENDLLEIGTEVRRANPGIHLVVISETGWHPALEELSPENYLPKPFHLPDLLKMMDNLFPIPQSPDRKPESGEPSGDPPWLSDVTRAAQHLTRLTLESSAQAALITRNDKLWAYAGQFPRSSTDELTDTVSRYWDCQKENDLARFVHLASTGAEHMLYATRLTQNMVLSLIFDAETPFGTIHTQANQLVRSLSTSPSEKQNAGAETDDESPSTPISAILSEIPSPNQDMDVKAPALEYLKESNPEISLPQAPTLRFSRESYPAVPFDTLTSTEEANQSIEPDKMVESPAVPRKNIFKKNSSTQVDLGETHPNPINESARKIVLEPVSVSVYNLDYACMLLPRFPTHHLIGDLSERLTNWVHETCIAYDWRLEYISVRPDYLLWNVNVPPATSPGNLMRIMRQRTSGKIFDDFPRFKIENPSGDFWASGYFIMGGSQPPPVQLIKEFIAQTRQRQGVNQQFR